MEEDRLNYGLEEHATNNSWFDSGFKERVRDVVSFLLRFLQILEEGISIAVGTGEDPPEVAVLLIFLKVLLGQQLGCVTIPCAQWWTLASRSCSLGMMACSAWSKFALSN